MKTRKPTQKYYSHLIPGSHSSSPVVSNIFNKMIQFRIMLHVSLFFKFGIIPQSFHESHTFNIFEDYNFAVSLVWGFFCCLFRLRFKLYKLYIVKLYRCGAVFPLQPIRWHRISICPITNDVHSSTWLLFELVSILQGSTLKLYKYHIPHQSVHTIIYLFILKWTLVFLFYLMDYSLLLPLFRLMFKLPTIWQVRTH